MCWICNGKNNESEVLFLKGRSVMGMVTCKWIFFPQNFTTDYLKYIKRFCVCVFCVWLLWSHYVYSCLHLLFYDFLQDPIWKVSLRDLFKSWYFMPEIEAQEWERLDQNHTANMNSFRTSTHPQYFDSLIVFLLLWSAIAPSHLFPPSHCLLGKY